MSTVWFRFYATLNHFLPYRQRHTRFVYRLRDTASVKDTIEAIGVPHPEVDLILISGEPSAFSARLADGDQVSVFPAFSSIDLPESLRVTGDPPRPVRFAADVHLRKLAAFLRLAGFDAVIEQDDESLAAIGARENRVVLTRDVALLKRTVVRYGYWVSAIDPEWQLAEVLRRFDLAERVLPFARCTRCNTPLVSVDAEAVASRLLPCTRAEFREFSECVGCKRVYWLGSHWRRLASLLDRATRRATEPEPGSDRLLSI